MNPMMETCSNVSFMQHVSEKMMNNQKSEINSKTGEAMMNGFFNMSQKNEEQ